MRHRAGRLATGNTTFVSYVVHDQLDYNIINFTVNLGCGIGAALCTTVTTTSEPIERINLAAAASVKPQVLVNLKKEFDK